MDLEIAFIRAPLDKVIRGAKVIIVSVYLSVLPSSFLYWIISPRVSTQTNCNFVNS